MWLLRLKDISLEERTFRRAEKSVAPLALHAAIADSHLDFPEQDRRRCGRREQGPGLEGSRLIDDPTRNDTRVRRDSGGRRKKSKWLSDSVSNSV